MTHEQIAENLLLPLWKGISSEYKAKYSYSIWQQFEDNLRSAAYTARLSLFLSHISQRLAIEIKGEDVAMVNEFLAKADEKAALRMLREDTTLCVLLVREANEEKKLTKAEMKAGLNNESVSI